MNPFFVVLAERMKKESFYSLWTDPGWDERGRERGEVYDNVFSSSCLQALVSVIMNIEEIKNK